MANEISVSVSLSASKGGASIQSTGQRAADMAGVEMITNVQAVGTSAEALVVGDIGTPGYCLLKNLDATNYVEIALDSEVATPFAKLLAGDIALFPAKTATMYAKANTSGIALLVSLVEV